VTIPDSVTSIYHNVFDGCSSLSNVIIPESVTTIGSYIFAGCSSLTSVSIPRSLKSISYQAFYECSSLNEVIIPDTVSEIGTSAFSRCSSLKSITVADNNTNYASIDGVLFTKDLTTLLQYPCGNNRSSYTIPDSVTIVRSNAFDGCNHLTSVTIPKSVNSIDTGAFSGCNNLPKIDVATDNPSFKSIEGVLFNKDETMLYQYPCGLNQHEYSIPDTVTYVNYGSFSGCTSLESVIIPDSVQTIGSSAFERCTSLKSITIPNSVTSIGESVFKGCNGLESVIIPDSVTAIGYRAFLGCSKLKSVSYLGSKDLGSSTSDVFSFCDALAFVCVQPEYSLLSFCGKSVYSSSSSPSCDDFADQSNQCFEVLVYNKTSATVNKRSNATEWENQSNGCVQYQCDNATGGISSSICQNKGEVSWVCVKDSECVEGDKLDSSGWKAVIDMEPIDAAQFNSIEVINTLSSLTGIDQDKMNVATEVDEKGRIVRVIVYLEDEPSVNAVVSAVNGISKEECSYGVICRRIHARVVSNNLFIELEGAPHLRTIFVAFFIAIAIMLN